MQTELKTNITFKNHSNSNKKFVLRQLAWIGKGAWRGEPYWSVHACSEPVMSGGGGRAVPVCATGHGLTASFGQIWTPWPYFQLKKAHTDGPSGRPSVKQATTQCCPRTPIESVYCIRKLPVPWCQITKAIPTARPFLFWGYFIVYIVKYRLQ